MTLLLDTHVLLWAAIGDPRLRGGLRRPFDEGDTSLVVSVATLWEISIKHSIGKLPLPVAPADFFAREIATRRYTVLDIRRAHAERVGTLAFPEGGHRDPFDRLLVAQALCEGMPLLSADERLASYADTGLVTVGP